MSVPLYEITGRYAEILRRFEEAESEAELASIADLLAQAEDTLEEKLDNCARVYRALCYESEVFAEEAKRLSKKSSALEGRAERLREYIGLCLGVGRSARSKLFSFSWRKSQSVEVDDMEALPEQYKRCETRIEPNKLVLKEVLTSGEGEEQVIIPGARLVTKYNLQIK